MLGRARRLVVKGGVALALAAALLAWACWWSGGGTAATPALASSSGTIDILSPAPARGPVDTVITLEVRVYPSAETAYGLAATRTAPDQGGCASATPLRTVAPYPVYPNRGGDVQFHWPAGLGSGQYWFCAAPTGGSGAGPAAMSLAAQPLTILTDNAPTVQVTAPTGRARAGAAVTVRLTNWITGDGTPPSQLALRQQGSSSDTIPNLGAQEDAGGSDPAAGTYVMTATVPDSVAAGSYLVVAEGDCGPDPLGTRATVCALSEPSAAFTVVAAPATATPAATATSASGNGGGATNPSGPGGAAPRQTGGGFNPVWLLVGRVALLLALLVVLRVSLTRHQQRTQAHSQAKR